MAVPNPRTWVVGETVTAAYMNGIRDALDFLLAVPMCASYNTGSFVVPTGATGASVEWGADEIDNDGIHSGVTNPARFTIVTPGIYVATFSFLWQAANVAVNYAEARITANHAGSLDTLARDIRPWYTSATLPGAAGSITTKPVRMAVGDYFYASAIHGYSSSLNLTGGQYSGSGFGLYFVGE